MIACGLVGSAAHALETLPPAAAAPGSRRPPRRPRRRPRRARRRGRSRRHPAPTSAGGWYIGFGLGGGTGRARIRDELLLRGSARTLRDHGRDQLRVGATVTPRLLVGFDGGAVGAIASGPSEIFQLNYYDLGAMFFPWERGAFVRGAVGRSVFTIDTDGPVLAGNGARWVERARRDRLRILAREGVQPHAQPRLPGALPLRLGRNRRLARQRVVGVAWIRLVLEAIPMKNHDILACAALVMLAAVRAADSDGIGCPPGSTFRTEPASRSRTPAAGAPNSWTARASPSAAMRSLAATERERTATCAVGIRPASSSRAARGPTPRGGVTCVADSSIGCGAGTHLEGNGVRRIRP